MMHGRWLLVALFLLTGCAHNFVYSGVLEAEDSTGKMRQHLLYWLKTERPIWFDTVEGSVRMLPQCSLNTVAYDEQPNGIVFRLRRGADKKIIGPAEPPICGEVLSAKRIKDLAEGQVELTVLCADAPPDDLDRPKPYLKARDQPYGFTASKREVLNFSDEGNVPARPTCESP